MNKAIYKPVVNKKNAIKLRGGDLVFMIIVCVVLALFFFVEFYPMFFIVIASFSDPLAVANGQALFWPVRPTLDGFKYVLSYTVIWLGYANTFFYTIVGTAVNLAVTLPCGYALSRRDLKGKRFFMVLFMFTMYFSGGLVPSYLNIRQFGLVDSRWVLIIPGAMSVYNMIVCRTFFSSTIPWELHEAARIDGASDFRTFARIVLPLSAPIIVVMILYYGVGHWNEYFNAMIYLKTRSKFPLQSFLREILIKGEMYKEEIAKGMLDGEAIQDMLKQLDTINMIKYCIIIIATVPMLALYPWLQKYFAKGVMIGSVKG